MARQVTDGQPRSGDLIQDLQRSGWSRWTPRRAGLPPLLEWWPSYILLIGLVSIAALVSVRLAAEILRPLGHVFVIAALASIVTFSLAPIVVRLEQWMPRRVAAIIVFFGTLAALLVLAAIIAWQFGGEGQRLSNQLNEFSEALKGNRPLAIGPYELPPNIQSRLRVLTEGGGRVDEWSAAMAVGLITSLIDLVLVFVITFYLLLDARRLRAMMLRWLEPRHRPGMRRAMSEIARVFGAYARAQLLVAVSLGILVAVLLLALGVPYALFLALFAALAELVPMVGPIAGAIPAILVAATLPLPTVLWVAIGFVVIQQIESNFLLPRLTGHAVGLHPVASLLVLVLGFELGGVVGALVSVPLAGLTWVFVSTAVGAWRDKRIDLHQNGDLLFVPRRVALRGRAAASSRT